MQQSVLLALAMAAAAHGAVDNSKLSPLRFREDGTFHISVFSDLHLGIFLLTDANSARGPKQDAKSVSVLATVLAIEDPDFAVINGDLINGDDTRVANSTHYIDQIVKPLVDRNLTWGSTYGNHDGQPNLSGELLLAREQTFPGARTQNMVPSDGGAAGSTNYFVPVFSATCEDKRGVDPNRQPGINEETSSPQAQGWCESDTRGCPYGKQDTAFMKAIASTKGMMGLFSGHDHANSWCYKWDGELPGVEAKGNGINLCYGQHTGYGGYGDLIRGSREILVSLDKLKDLVIDSHIRTEWGYVINPISLNATYGEDLYPVSPNDKTYLE
ncbi:hypothetical protein LLEC1_05825 [Akanthomyces lecanii]|uniref:Calcineurin-like phosphoesterase domain-containing protein n=1 Tax=Cordyceps confragosa TaxID=2714763 RepID=A0A179IJH3_CORDF|nr:hypothetical protein LLEC1_05825 [Akanthomyces lecanii]